LEMTRGSRRIGRTIQSIIRHHRDQGLKDQGDLDLRETDQARARQEGKDAESRLQDRGETHARVRLGPEDLVVHRKTLPELILDLGQAHKRKKTHHWLRVLVQMTLLSL